METTPGRPPTRGGQDRDEEGNAVADTAEEVVDRNPWLERITQWGWIAKAVVYVLMGVTAIRIAQKDKPTDDALRRVPSV